MEQKLKKRKKLKKQSKKASWKSLTKLQLAEVDVWLAANSMKENCRNTTLADIATHVSTTYGIKVVHSLVIWCAL